MINIKANSKELKYYLETIDKIIDDKLRVDAIGSIYKHKTELIYYLELKYFDIDIGTVIKQDGVTLYFPLDKTRYKQVHKIFEPIIESDNNEILLMYSKIALNIIKDYYNKYLAKISSKSKNTSHNKYNT